MKHDTRHDSFRRDVRIFKVLLWLTLFLHKLLLIWAKLAILM